MRLAETLIPVIYEALVEALIEKDTNMAYLTIATIITESITQTF